jgi:hypothetical protein
MYDVVGACKRWCLLLQGCFESFESDESELRRSETLEVYTCQDLADRSPRSGWSQLKTFSNQEMLLDGKPLWGWPWLGQHAYCRNGSTPSPAPLSSILWSLLPTSEVNIPSICSSHHSEFRGRPIVRVARVLCAFPFVQWRSLASGSCRSIPAFRKSHISLGPRSPLHVFVHR